MDPIFGGRVWSGCNHGKVERLRIEDFKEWQGKVLLEDHFMIDIEVICQLWCSNCNSKYRFY